MGLIPRQFIDDLISRINIVDIIETRVPLKKRGGNYLGLCPFHNEKTPSFNVNTTKQFYHCFGCGMSGNVVSFLMDHDRLDFVSAIEFLAHQLGLEVPQEKGSKAADPSVSDLYTLLEKTSRYFQHQLRKNPLAKTALSYLKDRGLYVEIIKEFAIGYAPPGWDNLQKEIGVDKNARDLLLSSGMTIKKSHDQSYDRFRDRIMFPIRDRRGKVIGFGGRVLNKETPKYLNSPETPVFHKSQELYGLYEALKRNRTLEQVIVVEGYMDVITLFQHNIPFAVATLGTSTSKNHIQLLQRYTSSIIFCFDGDQAGKDASTRALEICLSQFREGTQFRFLFLPSGEDPDSIVRKEGTEVFLNRLKESELLSNVLLKRLSDQVNIQSIDGKSRYIKLAIPYLKLIPAGPFKMMLLDQIGSLLHLDSDRLQQLMNEKSTPEQADNNEKKAPPFKPSHHEIIIALLIQQPTLIRHIKSDQLPGELSSSSLTILQKLITSLKKHPHLTTAHLLEYWREDENYPTLLKLASWQHPVPGANLEQEFTEVWQHFQQTKLQQQIDLLINKANQSPLSLEEKKQLQSLLQRKQRKEPQI